MALSNSQYDSIMRIYNQAQLRQKRELDKRREEVYEKIPAVKEINEEITASAVKSARQLLAGDDRSAKGLKRRIADLCEEREVLLSAYGYPADYLELHYDCPDCCDTGYRDGKKCHCFKKREISLLYDQSNIREILSRENFDTFSYEYFDDTKVDERSNKTAREYMRQVVALCRSYVEHFGEHKDNLLFTGKTGLGTAEREPSFPPIFRSMRCAMSSQIGSCRGL